MKAGCASKQLHSVSFISSQFLHLRWTLPCGRQKKLFPLSKMLLGLAFVKNTFFCHRIPQTCHSLIMMTNHFHQKSRCAWHCMDLVVDGGTCNAILYDRKSKVMVYKRYMILIIWQGLKEKGCFCVEYNSGLSNGRGQACGFPNWGHWSKGCLEQVRQAMPFVSISSCNSGNIVLSMATLNLSSSTYVSSGWPYGLSAWFAVDRKTQGEPNDFYHRWT